MKKPTKEQKNLSFAEQTKLYCKMCREGTLTPLDDDDISLGMINIDWSDYDQAVKSKGSDTVIDICFGDSLGGMLKAIQRKLHSKEILVFPLNLPYGTLCGDIVKLQAKREAETFWYAYKDITEPEVNECYEELLEDLQDAQNALSKYFNTGDALRLWISDTARDRCALYWFCNLAQEYKNPISVVYQPKYEYNNITEKTKICTRWEMVEDFGLLVLYAEKAVKLESAEKQAYAAEWNHIVSDNAPLRILIDNTIVGVKEDFFDDTILNFVSNEPRTQSYVMGTMLGKWQGGCDVAFISQRIEHLIESGKIKVCEEKVDEEGCYWARTLILA